MRNLRKTKRQQEIEQRRRQEKGALKEALERLEELEAHVASIRRLKRKRKSVAIRPHKGSGSEATAIVVASDWHIGQEVSPGSVNNLNEYNAVVAKDRAGKFFSRLIKLVNKERADVGIHTLVLFLGGDFVEGSLHLDTIMGSDLTGIMNQAVLAQELLQGGLEYVRDHGEFKKVVVVCSDGNHGRVSQKQHHHSRRGNALEYYLYFNLAARFPEFEWVIDESLLTYVPVYDKMLRFMHGDRISFGGVNGFYTYLHRRIYEWDTSMRADYTILGHLHQYTPNRRYLVNGSLVGFNPFAISLGAKYEPPTQAFMLWDKDRGPTVQIPVLFD